MSRRFDKCCRPSRRGTTLVEAVVGTALLGTLLTSILIAGGRLQTHAAGASRRIEAYSIADSLLSKWWSDKASFPREGSGGVDGNAGWTWRTRKVENPVAMEFIAEVVLLEVLWTNEQGQQPLARVEVVLPAERPDRP